MFNETRKLIRDAFLANRYATGPSVDWQNTAASQQACLAGQAGDGSVAVVWMNRHCGTIPSDEIWSSNVVQIVDCPVTVSAGATLTIQPGTCVKFASGASLSVSSGAILSAPGTGGGHITFTSLRDDITCDGDTNGDGTATTAQPGDWFAVEVFGQASVNYADFKYGGATPCCLPRGMLALRPGATLNGLDNSTFASSATSGLSTDNATLPAAWANNTFTGSAEYAVRLTNPRGSINPVGGSGTGNGAGNGIALQGNFAANTTLHALAPALPYIPNATVPSPLLLTIDPGACLKFALGASLGVNPGAILSAPGTGGGHITFTSLRDDITCGGDTNGDGGATTAQPGDWYAVDVSGQASVNYADFKYGGATPCCLPRGMLALRPGATLNGLDNSTFTNSSTSGLSADSATLPTAWANNNFTGNAQYAALITNPRGSINPVGGGGTGNGAGNGIALQGNFAANTTLHALAPALPYIPNVTVPAPLLLTIDPRACLKFEPTGSIFVDGALSALGTSTIGIIFTSLRDDFTCGGDTNGNAGLPAAGDWGQVWIRNGAQATFTYAGFLFGGNANPAGMVAVTSGAITTMSTSILYSSSTAGLYLDSAACTGTTCHVVQSTIVGNAAYGVRNVRSGTLADATSSWWGASNGPMGDGCSAATGSGDKVSCFVLFNAWASAKLDLDTDGCADTKELGSSLTFGGKLNPLDHWDFYSVPVPALYAAPDPTTLFPDDIVGASDAQAVFAYFKAGAIAGTTVYEQDLNNNGIKDGVEYDRTVAGPAKSGPPDGIIAASDAQLAFAQFKFGYSCRI